MTTEKITEELNRTMASALKELQRLVEADISGRRDFVPVVSAFLGGVVSTGADLVDLQLPGGGLAVLASVEALAKARAINSVRAAVTSAEQSSDSVSGIAVGDVPAAMNYLGQELSVALFKAIHELPVPHRKPEMLLRGVEALLANLLSQRFANSSPHDVLDSLCEHVHMALNDLEGRKAQRTH
ncbi:hypothetical protein ACTOWA_00390 [Herbaspirillum seropedicae]|uniref:hypothetical protein n=1 Tax=Herbaspirillum seropedicae TaxID=964 RepID=UPI0028618468|nr:hypothetical protein [Herbaspirillum seropedicae]MDR6397952.1 hypothetical protein [Herbaspirillum seropedicae]